LADEAIDIGMDTRTPVDDNDYQVPFHFTGKIAKLNFKLGPEQLTEMYRKVMHQYVIRGSRLAEPRSPGSPLREDCPSYLRRGWVLLLS